MERGRARNSEWSRVREAEGDHGPGLMRRDDTNTVAAKQQRCGDGVDLIAMINIWVVLNTNQPCRTFYAWYKFKCSLVVICTSV